MIEQPRCHARRCEHFRGVSQPDGTEESEKVVCTAFPKGIPREIAFGGNPHYYPLPGQGNKIVFEFKGEKL